ncbi:hypothetical protein NDU88_001401 [Pleurodeles waltl]|uniref:Uncharacterized protein n=1 Tax=Pleurodeles waltl TaxID=8319 RepID=A0AAV7LHB6_PLEWA|nr:hypothetical protein NDU88_001401 [Pleurodeles waltl]
MFLGSGESKCPAGALVEMKKKKILEKFGTVMSRGSPCGWGQRCRCLQPSPPVESGRVVMLPVKCAATSIRAGTTLVFIDPRFRIGVIDSLDDLVVMDTLNRWQAVSSRAILNALPCGRLLRLDFTCG